MFELMQLEMGMSTSRYFPAMGTAGLLRLAVSGNNRVPAPPPNITATVDCGIVLILAYCLLLMGYIQMLLLNAFVYIDVLLCAFVPAEIQVHDMPADRGHPEFIFIQFNGPVYGMGNFTY